MKLLGTRLIEDVELILGVEHFNYLFFFFFFFLCDGRIRRSTLLDCMLWWQGFLWNAFRYGIGEKRAF